jgi:hypothetical protein
MITFSKKVNVFSGTVNSDEYAIGNCIIRNNRTNIRMRTALLSPIMGTTDTLVL